MTQCIATSKRSQERCKKRAIKGKHTCHMHGGRSKGPTTVGGKECSRLAALKHGGYTKDALAEYKKAMELIRLSKSRLRLFK